MTQHTKAPPQLKKSILVKQNILPNPFKSEFWVKIIWWGIRSNTANFIYFTNVAA